MLRVQGLSAFGFRFRVVGSGLRLDRKHLPSILQQPTASGTASGLMLSPSFRQEMVSTV